MSYDPSETFYTEPTANSMQNFQSSNHQQAMQLNVASLLPRSFMTGQQPVSANADDDSWYKYAPSRQGFENSVIASGSTRIQQLSRRETGKKLGTANMLRDQPAMTLTSSEPWFNSSSYRSDMLFDSRRS